LWIYDTSVLFQHNAASFQPGNNKIKRRKELKVLEKRRIKGPDTFFL
jgi:hypothetical protein